MDEVKKHKHGFFTRWCLEVFGAVELHPSAADETSLAGFWGHYRTAYLLKH